MRDTEVQTLRHSLYNLTVGALRSFRTLLDETDETKLTKPDEIRGALAQVRLLVSQCMDTLSQLTPAIDALCNVRSSAIDDAVSKIRRKTEIEVTLDRIGKAHFKEVSGYAKRCIDRLVEEAQSGQDEYDFEHGTTTTEEDE